MCEIIPSPNEIEKQMGALNTKLPVLKKQHLNLKVVNVSVTVVVFTQANAQHSSSHPPPPKKKNWHEIVAFLTIVVRQNLSLIFLRNSRKIGRFFCKFVSKNPTNLILFCDLSEAQCYERFTTS